MAGGGCAGLVISALAEGGGCGALGAAGLEPGATIALGEAEGPSFASAGDAGAASASSGADGGGVRSSGRSETITQPVAASTLHTSHAADIRSLRASLIVIATTLPRLGCGRTLHDRCAARKRPATGNAQLRRQERKDIRELGHLLAHRSTGTMAGSTLGAQ